MIDPIAKSVDRVLAEIKASIDQVPADQVELLKSRLANEVFKLDEKVNLSELKLPETEVSLTPEFRRQIFLQTYNVIVDQTNHTISFTLPVGKSRIDLINEAAILNKELYSKKTIAYNRFRRWRQDPVFVRAVNNNPLQLKICGYVKGSEEKYKPDKSRKVLSNVHYQDLVTAHSVYLAATGQDMFAGHPVIAKKGIVLRYMPYGIVYSPNARNYDVRPVAASKSFKIDLLKIDNIISLSAVSPEIERPDLKNG